MKITKITPRWPSKPFGGFMKNYDYYESHINNQNENRTIGVEFINNYAFRWPSSKSTFKKT
jgi:hypothetical protein